MTGAGPRRGFSRLDAWLVLGLLLVGAVLPLLIEAIAGTFEVPRNDDWSYRRLALEFASTGRLSLDGAASAMLVGQLLVVQPFLWLSGLDAWAFAAAGFAFAAVAVLAAYALARQLLPPRSSAFVTGLVLLFPGYLAYAGSFMTDVPTLACEFLCVALGCRAVMRRPVSVPLLVAALAIGLFGFSIRHFAIAAPASVAVAAICAQPRRARYWAIGFGALAGAAAIYIWRAGLPGVLGEASPHPESVQRLLPALVSIALVVSPAAILAIGRWRRMWHLIDVVIGAGLGLAVVAGPLLTVLREHGMPTVILQNLTTQWGTTGAEMLIGGRPLLFGNSLWATVNALAILATITVGAVGAGVVGAHVRGMSRSPAALIRGLGSPAGLLLIFTFSVVAGMFAYGIVWRVFDRYFWPVVAPLSILLLYVPPDLARRRAATARPMRTADARGAAILACAPLALIATVLMLNSNAFDAGRWQAGEKLVAEGVPAETIDAGYEWIGFHAVTPANAAKPVPARTWYEGWWAGFKACGLVSSLPLTDAGAELIGTSEYALNLVAGPPQTLYLYRLSDPGCPAP